MQELDNIVEAVKQGEPVYLEPYREPKVWGAVDGIGEFWYGCEKGDKSATAVSGDDEAPFSEVVEKAPEAVLGKKVVDKFGVTMPLVKILTPKGRLSAQFHEAKNELWIVTGIDEAMAGGAPSIILGFSAESVDKYGSEVAGKYGEALEVYGKALNELIDILEREGFKEVLEAEADVIRAASSVSGDCPGAAGALETLLGARENMEWFYNNRPVKVGDVIPVPALTLHALGPGIEIVEPQIFGTTQSTEDGATYPVRYYFPGYERPGAGKKLDVDRVGEMRPEVTKEGAPVVISEAEGVKVEKLPGDLADKGLEVYRIDMKKGAVMTSATESFHNLVSVKGSARVEMNGYIYPVPAAKAGGRMLIIPASAGEYKLIAGEDTQVIDTFTPV